MSKLSELVDRLVVGNRILAHEDVFDAYGHISARHPDNPNHYLLSCSRSPQFIDREDILEFTLDGTCVSSKTAKPYLERFIHGAIYEARPEVNAVVHSHAAPVLPFTVSSVPIRPMVHFAADMGYDVPVWDIEDRFGATSLLVMNMEQARDLAKCLGPRPVALMRGHGFVAAAPSLEEVVQVSVFLPKNARVQLEAIQLGGSVKHMSAAEVKAKYDAGATGGRDRERAWDYWAIRCGCKAHDNTFRAY
jgi:ribulose-5-phosphate 4-epimerase/fuculose-1-phosphate aldolase